MPHAILRSEINTFLSLLRRSICSIISCFVNYDITDFFRQLLTWGYISQNLIQNRPKNIEEWTEKNFPQNIVICQ